MAGFQSPPDLLPRQKDPKISNISDHKTSSYLPWQRGRNAHQQSKSKSMKWRNDIVLRTTNNWWLEMLAMFSILATFCGTVAFLQHFQRQPIPSLPAEMSINTVLSVFGVLFKAPLLFVASQGLGQLKWQWFQRKRPLSDFNKYDEASRGPWGAFILLWDARWRHVTAFTGAMITVVALGVDPFTQAVVSYRTCDVQAGNAIAQVNRINSFFSRALGHGVPTGVHVALGNSFTIPTSLLPDHICTAPECHFSEPYHTIGMCSTCTDATDEIVVSCDSYPMEICNYTLMNLAPPGYSGTYVNTTAQRNATVLYTATETNVTIAQEYDYDILAINKLDEQEESWDTTELESGPGDRPSYQSSTINLISPNPLLGARCVLSFCVRTYVAQIKAGILRETLLSTSRTWSNSTRDNALIGMVRVDCLNDRVRSRLLADNSIGSLAAEWMPWDGIYLNGTELDDHISTSRNLSIPTACSYQLRLMDVFGFFLANEAFSDFIAGTIGGSGQYNSIPDPSPETPNHLLQLWNNGSISLDSIDSSFENFTRVISNYMRNQNSPLPRTTPYLSRFTSSGSDPVNAQYREPDVWNQPARGTAITTTTCVHVRWQWLALPASLTIAVSLFLLALIIQNADESGHGVWKSSQEAVLWHGLEGPAENESVWLITKEEMQRKAKKLNVRLSNAKKGWKLIEKE